MAESDLSTAAADAMSGTTETGIADSTYPTIGEATYYTTWYQQTAKVLRVLGLPNQLRVYKDGDLTYGVRAGSFLLGGIVRTYAGATAQVPTNDDTSYIYLDSTGTLVANITGFPTNAAIIPLATLAAAESAGGVTSTYAATDITDYHARVVFAVPDAYRQVEENTAGVASPNVLADTETAKAFTNEDAGALNYHTLPTAAVGLTYTFYVQDGNGIRVTANTADTIRLAGQVSIAAGYVSSTEVGASITLLAVNATEWVATSLIGTWTVETS